MPGRLPATIAANRFGLGARAGDLDHIGEDARGWLRAQLEGLAPAIGDGTLQHSQSVLAQALALRRENAQARKGPPGGAATVPVEKLGELLRPIYTAEVLARFQHTLGTERPFLERLTQFWSNHFAVSIDKNLLAGLAGSFEREAIRPHVLGSFRDLLLAVEQHPAMLLYLDNTSSTGPHSPAARRRDRREDGNKAGINENLAREILELHTLGVGSGYTQADVTTFAQVISGWSVGRPGQQTEEPGRFMFRPGLHEPGDKTVLGTGYPDGGLAQGEAVLTALATHPATARHIATKLARHFIADEPAPDTIERLTAAFIGSGGQLMSVYHALIEAPESWNVGLAKLKTPADFLVSTYRGLGLPAANEKAVVGAFDQLGQRVFAPRSPAGWPDRSADWDGASALLKRIEWADTVARRIGGHVDARALGPVLLGANLTAATGRAIASCASPAQGITLLLASPEFMRR